MQTPPPDDPAYVSSTKPASRPWFPVQGSSHQVASYQSGGIPTFNTSQAGGLGNTEDAEVENGSSMWETRYGLRVDMLAASAYVLGPISGEYSYYCCCCCPMSGAYTTWLALILLIVETHNDYVRFHGEGFA